MAGLGSLLVAGILGGALVLVAAGTGGLLLTLMLAVGMGVGLGCVDPLLMRA